MSGPARIRVSLSPAAARYARRDAPVEARRMAARGALPLPPSELAAVLFVLMHDPDDQVKTCARESLEGLPVGVLEAALSGPTDPAVLSYLARFLRERPELLEKVALNPASDDATIAFLAARPSKALVELVASNQQRLLRCPEIVEALGTNPLAGRAVIDRVLSFLGYPDPAPAAPDETEPAPDREIGEAEAATALRALLGAEAESVISGLCREREFGEAQRMGLHALVQRLSVLEKVQLARLGNQEARSLLVRDPNRIVATAAIRSPRIREDEVVAIAKARNVCEEVMRAIAEKREWTRSYRVKLALATNPKCPLPKAIQLLHHLQERDLRQAARSKEVPAAVAAQARRILARKEGR